MVEACGRDVGEGSVGVADDGAGVGACESTPSDGYILAGLEVAQDFLGSGHVRLAGGGHVSCEDGYNPADLGHGAGLEEE